MTEDRNVLEERIRELENELAKRGNPSFWTFDTWQNSIKSLSMPIALSLGLFAFWNTVVLGLIGRDSGSIEQLRSNIEAIQAMDQEIYVLNQQGADAEASATEAAVVARRDRLVAETFDHWRRNPDYFRPPELQILIHHLILQYRISDAIEVFEDYWPTLSTPFEKANGRLLEARIYSRGGDLLDVDRAVGNLRQAFVLSEGIPNPIERSTFQGQLLYKRGLIELDNKGDCQSARAIAQGLEEAAAEDRSGQLAMSANDMRERVEQSCEDSV